jgi:hypothetical protein
MFASAKIIAAVAVLATSVVAKTGDMTWYNPVSEALERHVSPTYDPIL